MCLISELIRQLSDTEQTKSGQAGYETIIHLLSNFILFSHLSKGNQKVKSIIVTEVTVRSPFITYSSQNPCNFLDMEVIMIKEDDKC